MCKKPDIFREGLQYLDTNSLAERLIITGLAAIVSPDEIARGFKNAHIESHRLHLAKGNFEGASAALHLAAIVDEGMAKQEKTFQRRAELIHGVVLERRFVKERRELSKNLPLPLGRQS